MQTKYFTGKKITSPRGRTYRDRPTREDIDYSRYAEQKGVETANVINTSVFKMTQLKQEQDKYDTAPIGSYLGPRPTSANITKDDFEGGALDKIKVGGSVKEVRGVELSDDGKLVLVYDSASPDRKTGTPMQDEISYDIYNPESMRDFYSATAVQGGASGAKAMRLYSSLYDREMVNQYTSPDGLKALASSNEMSKWFDFVLAKGGSEAKNKMIEYAALNPNVYLMSSGGTSHWVNFASANSNAIELFKVRNNIK